jgi:hypothetical protein
MIRESSVGRCLLSAHNAPAVNAATATNIAPANLNMRILPNVSFKATPAS